MKQLALRNYTVLTVILCKFGIWKLYINYSVNARYIYIVDYKLVIQSNRSYCYKILAFNLAYSDIGNVNCFIVLYCNHRPR